MTTSCSQIDRGSRFDGSQRNGDGSERNVNLSLPRPAFVWGPLARVNFLSFIRIQNEVEISDHNCQCPFSPSASSIVFATFMHGDLQ